MKAVRRYSPAPMRSRGPSISSTRGDTLNPEPSSAVLSASTCRARHQLLGIAREGRRVRHANVAGDLLPLYIDSGERFPLGVFRRMPLHQRLPHRPGAALASR